MVHNQVPELVKQLQNYALTIWPFFNPSKTGVEIDDAVLFVADYPNTNYMERLMEYTDPLKVIVSVTDQGVVSKRSLQFAESRREYSIRIAIEIITADPTLRDEIGGCLYEFIDSNPEFFKGTESDWRIEDIDSSGITPAPASLFGRTYHLWLVEHS